jgi:hypothetical protein
MPRSWSTWLRLSASTCAAACVIATGAGRALAETDNPQSDVDQTPQEVTVTATRELDHSALSHAVSGFVESHSSPSTRINQIGRWHEIVCPQVTGLEQAGRDYITRQIVDVARGVGAPTVPTGKKCTISVEIVFTRQPQALLDRIARAFKPMLGFYPVSQTQKMATFSRPIQAWYTTGTRSMETQLPIVTGSGSTDQSFGGGPAGAGLPPIQGGAQIDSDITAMGMQPSGVAGSHLGRRTRSEFAHVLIIADSTRLERYPLHSIADYMALLSLTRMTQLEHCAPLPSITDLLASDCTSAPADALTAADRAYLKALYSADLEQNLNLERGEVHEQMMRAIEGK